MRFSAELYGANEIVAALKSLPGELVSKNGGPVRQELYKIGATMKRAAIALAPKRDGLLWKSIRLVRDKNPAKSGASERYVLGVFGGNTRKYANTKRNRRTGRVGKTYTIINAYYWRFQEFGTQGPHPVPKVKFLDRSFRMYARTGIDEFTVGLSKRLNVIAQKYNKTRIR
jgi:hypothetical protein